MSRAYASVRAPPRGSREAASGTAPPAAASRAGGSAADATAQRCCDDIPPKILGTSTSKIARCAVNARSPPGVLSRARASARANSAIFFSSSLSARSPGFLRVGIQRPSPRRDASPVGRRPALRARLRLEILGVDLGAFLAIVASSSPVAGRLERRLRRALVSADEPSTTGRGARTPSSPAPPKAGRPPKLQRRRRISAAAPAAPSSLSARMRSRLPTGEAEASSSPERAEALTRRSGPSAIGMETRDRDEVRRSRVASPACVQRDPARALAAAGRGTPSTSDADSPEPPRDAASASSPPCSSTNDRILDGETRVIPRPARRAWSTDQQRRTAAAIGACTHPRRAASGTSAGALAATTPLYERARRRAVGAVAGASSPSELVLYARIARRRLRVGTARLEATAWHARAAADGTRGDQPRDERGAASSSARARDQCTKEQTLLARLRLRHRVAPKPAVARRPSSAAYQRGELPAALHEHKIERYHRQPYRYVEEGSTAARTSRPPTRFEPGAKPRRRLGGADALSHAPRRRRRGRAANRGARTRSSSTAPSTTTRRRRGRPPPSSPRARAGRRRVSPVVDGRSKNSAGQSALARQQMSSGSGAKPALVPRSRGCRACDDLGSSIVGASASAGGGRTRERLEPPSAAPGPKHRERRRRAARLASRRR